MIDDLLSIQSDNDVFELFSPCKNRDFDFKLVERILIDPDQTICISQGA